MREIADWVVPARLARQFLTDAVALAGFPQKITRGGTGASTPWIHHRHHMNIAYLYLLPIRYKHHLLSSASFGCTANRVNER